MTDRPTEPSLTERLSSLARRHCAALAACALALFLFHPFFLHGMVLNGNHDRADYAIPMHALFSSAFKSFSLPQWNPYMFCGNSLFSGAGYIYFYPLHWPLWLFPAAALPFLLTLSTLAHFWLFAFFLVMIIEKESGSRTAAALCAAAVCLSNPVVTAVASGEGMLMHFTWLAALLYLRVTAAERDSRRNFLLSSVAATLMLLGSMIQMAVYSLGLYALFSVILSLKEGSGNIRAKLRAVSIPLAPLAAAFLLSGPRLIPFFLSGSGKTAPITLAAFIRRGGAGLDALLRLFSGGFFGYDLTKPYPLALNSYEAFNAFAGIAFVIFATWGLRLAWKKYLPWAVCAAAALLFSLRSPLQFVQYMALGRAEVIYSRLAWFLPLFLSIPAAHALASLENSDGQSRKKAALPAGMLCAAVFIWILFLFPQPAAVSAEWARKSVAAFLVSSALLVTALTISANRKVFLSLVAAAMLLDVGVSIRGAANSSNPFFSDRIYPPLSDTEKSIAAAFYGKRDFRIYGASPNTADFACINAGLYNASGYDNAPPQRITELYAYPARPGRTQARKVGPNNAAAIAFSANAGIIAPDGTFIPANRYLPRFAVFHKAAVEPDPDKGLALLEAGTLPEDVLLLEKQPALPPMPGSGKVKLLRETLNSITIETQSTSPALLYIGDVWAAGWSASVDGKPTEILRAAHAFRAVSIPAGRSTVRMEYSAGGLAAGFAAATAGLALLLFSLLKPPKVQNN